MKQISLKTKLLAVLVVLALAGCSVPAVSIKLNPQGDTSTNASQAQPVVAVEKPSTAIQVAPQSLTAQEETLVQLYEKLNPSVVSIRVVLSTSSTGQTFQFPGNPGNPGNPNDNNQSPNSVIPDQAEGSGFILDTAGHIVTNNHVVEGADRVVVTFSDGTEAEATVVGTDPYTDLAVIKVNVDSSLLVPVTLGDSESLKVGQTVIAIGNPYNLNNSMSTGIISGLGRMLDVSSDTISSTSNYSIPNVIQTDAAINPGNSGGPLFNLDGQVIGVNSAIESPVRASSGVGYAIPSALVAKVASALIADGKVQHAMLGIKGGTLTADLAKAMGLDANQRGILVTEVVDGGPAAKAGLQGSSKTATIDGIETKIGGDVITAIDGKTVKVFDDLLGYILTYTKAGDTVNLTILRDGKEMQVKVTLEARP